MQRFWPYLFILWHLHVLLPKCLGAGDTNVLLLNHVSRECRDPETMAEFYTSVMGFSRVPAPPFPFVTIWLYHPSGVTMHLIEGTPDYGLVEGPARDASTGNCSQHVFMQGNFDPIHIRRGHHLAWTVKDLESIKAALGTRGIPFGTSTVPGTDTRQVFAFDPEGNGLEFVYKPPPNQEL